jgi:hypothetical protein
VVFQRPEDEPAQELPGCSLLGCPETRVVDAGIGAEESWQDLGPDRCSRGRPASVDETHDLGIVVDGEHMVHVVLAERAQRQALGLQERERGHAAILGTLSGTRQ